MENLSKQKKGDFYFKQFKIRQPENGLKITTDACVFGAICSRFEFKKVIDIGTGTGVLSLMYAQKNINSDITAIEIDNEVFNNALINIMNSNFVNQITPYNIALQDFKTNQKFDFIICNPPFFKNNLKGKNHQINLAIHDDSMSMEDLLKFVLTYMSSKGMAAFIYPPYESLVFENLANKLGLFTLEIIKLYNLPNKHFRNIHLYSFMHSNDIKIKMFAIKNENNRYSDEMNELMLDFYI